MHEWTSYAIVCCAVLNPAYKLQYFKTNEWLDDWIDEAIRLVTEAWKSRYKPPPRKPPVKPRPVKPGQMHANTQPPVSVFYLITSLCS